MKAKASSPILKNIIMKKIHVIKPDRGFSIEEQMRRVTASNEPIEKTSELIYTERKDGVLPQYDIRTDRFEIAIDAMDKYAKSESAHSEERAHEQQTTQNSTTDEKK